MRSRYDLHMKVPSTTREDVSYVIRRRAQDGGFECSCPRWVQQREECVHVRTVKPALSKLPKAPDCVEQIVTKAIDDHQFLIQGSRTLINRIVRELKAIAID